MASQREKNEALLRQLLTDLDVDTGDVVIFDRKCSKMSLYGGTICVCAKFFGHTQWDHNGVVIRVPSSSSSGSSSVDELYLLEAALSGVKMRPLVERILRSQSHDVSVRKLQVHRTPEFHGNALEFTQLVMDSPYEDRPQPFINAGVKVPTRIERERLFHAVVAKKKQLAGLDNELQHRHNMPEFERNALLKERMLVHDQYHALVYQLSETERSFFENDATNLPHQGKTFCSQLVAGLYQHLGLLLPYPATNSYLPKHFSANDGEGYLKLQQDATFLPEISVRRLLQENHDTWRQRKKEEKERAPQTTEEINAIVHCLRRHQLFHTLSESELVEISTSFRRRVLDEGEVVFYQGTQGDYFYIIEQGECQVFVDYDHLSTMTQGHEEGSGDTNRKGPPLQLQRRKTLALPEFNNSSSLVGKNERVLVATNGAGNAFGESSLIYDTPRRATLRAATGETTSSKSSSPSPASRKVVLWQLDKPTFKKIIETYPSSQQSMEERIFLMETISEHPLFSELDERAKALAVRKCFPLHVRAGSTILKQGDSGDYFYLVESGKCEILRKKPKAETPFVDRVVGKGASFGEAALLYNSRRGATVKAIEDTKIWCMDRTSFVTITRSGSAALLKLFTKVSNTVTKDGKEAFATQKDIDRMLNAPDKLRQRGPSSYRMVGSELPNKNAYDRAVMLAFSLLFHDTSGLINFSQFAHFHIALGASNIEQLLPEAAFRVLKSLEPGSDVPSSQQGAIKLKNLPETIRQWSGQSTSLSSSTLLKSYERLFDLPPLGLGDRWITQSDLAHVITALSDEHEEELDDSSDVAEAKAELRAFIAVLKQDIDALRTIWRAAEFHADGMNPDINEGKAQLTFDSNLKSGWISAIRHNPTGGDWEYLRPDLETDQLAGLVVASPEMDELFMKKKLYVQATSFAAAIAAGALARTVCAPLERLKILMQVSTPPSSSLPRTAIAPYTSLSRGVVNMVKLGGVRSLYSGNFAHCLWLIPSLPTKFLLCDVFRNQLRHVIPDHTPDDTNSDYHKMNKITSDLRNLIAGGLAGITANTLLYPLDVVRGRLSAQQYYNAERQYKGIRDCFQTMHRREGLSAFYRGLAPSTAGVFMYIGCNYSIYEYLRPMFILYDTESTSNQLGHPSIPGQILCATTTSLTSQFLSYPFDVIRRRMQLQGTWHAQMTFPTYSSSWNCVMETIREDPAGRRLKVRALYNGLFVNCVKALPSAVISFLSYEKIREMKNIVDEFEF